MKPGRAREKGADARAWVVSRRPEHEYSCRQRCARNPVRLIGSPGQRNDIASAHALGANAAIADKGYDADHLCDRLAPRALAR